jgi:hypothetical protein
MTQVGHTLTGLAIGVLCLPSPTSRLTKAVHLAAFLLLANTPDFPFDNWGHDRYDISHSLFVNLLLITTAMLVVSFTPKLRAGIGGGPVITGAVIAWLSHLLLDSFYNHGLGVAIFWPFSPARLALPIPWFSLLPNSPPPFTAQVWRAYSIEFACYFPLLLAAIALITSGGVRRLGRIISRS